MSIGTVRRIRTVVLLTLVVFAGAWFLMNRKGPDRHHYAAVFDDASEVVAKNDVRLNDVIVGKVTGIDQHRGSIGKHQECSVAPPCADMMNIEKTLFPRRKQCALLRKNCLEVKK